MVSAGFPCQMVRVTGGGGRQAPTRAVCHRDRSLGWRQWEEAASVGTLCSFWRRCHGEGAQGRPSLPPPPLAGTVAP